MIYCFYFVDFILSNYMYVTQFSKRFLAIIFLFCSFVAFSQSHFKMINNSKKEFISFQLLSNLIVFPLEVNGKKLNFILDSGVGSTILFNLNPADSITLKNVQKIKLQGLGSEEPLDAVLSKGNRFKWNNLVNENVDVFVVSNEKFDLSSKLGMTIHGIIGHVLLKDFVVEIKYGAKKMKFYKHEKYRYKNCRRCEYFDLEFYKLKPFVNVKVKIDKESEKLTPVKLLIDTGGSDALWLFEGSHQAIVPPKNYFIDFLGEGLSGAIYGKRSKIASVEIGDYTLKNPTVSYPDSLSISFARDFEERNGSLGGEVLKRFTLTLDYKNGRILFKRGSGFRNPFRYNMSGIELVHSGQVLVQEKEIATFSLEKNQEMDAKNELTLKYNYKFSFKPSYKIEKIRLGSPAYLAGLLPGDILIKINNKYCHDLKLEEIIDRFYDKKGKKISLLIERNGVELEYEFLLKSILD